MTQNSQYRDERDTVRKTHTVLARHDGFRTLPGAAIVPASPSQEPLQ